MKPSKKKNKRPAKGLVIVTWVDIVSRADWVGERAEVLKDPGAAPIPCVSVGWLIRDDKTMVLLADSYSKDKTFGGTTAIPRGVVIEVVELEAKTPAALLKQASAKLKRME